MIPRSEGGLLMSPSTSQDALYSTSPLSEYSTTIPDPGAPDGTRRSTSASEALQYYWSSSAGERNGSVGSNLGKSSMDSSRSNILASPYTLSPHPLVPAHQSMSPMMIHTKSDVSLQELVAQEEDQARLRAAAMFADASDDDARYGELPDPRSTPGLVHRDPGAGSEAAQSNRRIHLVSYPSDGSIPRAVEQPPSPSSSNSGESEYSLPDDSGELERPDAKKQLDSPQPRPIGGTSVMARPRGLVDAEGRLDVLLDPSFEEWAHQRSWAEDGGKSSSAPISPIDTTSPTSASDRWHTPSTSLLDRRRGAPTTRTPSPRDRTPRNSNFSGRSSIQTPRPSLPKSGRLLFVAPADVSRRSIDALEREVNGLGLDTTRGSRVGLSILGKDHVDNPEMPHSAPALKTKFGDLGIPEARRPTSLLPSVNMASPGHPSTPKLVPPSGSQVNARRSPEPPPRSELRKQRTRTPTPPRGPVVMSPTSESPVDDNNNTIKRRPDAGLRTHTLPTIINTPNTPVTSPQAPNRSSRVPSPRSHTAPLPGGGSRSESPQVSGMTESGTIQDLTKILGGAIDEIGLIDSRDTPPPNIGEPSKSRTPLTLAQVPVRSVSNNAQTVPIQTPEQQSSQLSPTGNGFQGTSPNSTRGNMLASSPVGLGIMSSVGASVAAAGGAASQRTGNVARHVRKASSILSLRSSNYSHMSPTASTFSGTGPSLPSAIMYGNIKQLKSAGDRARAYAQCTAELLRGDSGLREWLYTSQLPSRPLNNPRPTKAAGMSLLGLRAPETEQARNVSGGSEFPMRVDAYSARELSVRNLEPQDAPTALPSNLPYPQLQQHIKGSNSMQSLASMSSYKPQTRGLGRAFNFLKRDKENASLTSLGPMNPGAFGNMGPPAMSGSKRELRGMPISSPTYSPGQGRASLDSLDGPRVQPSLAVPRGPRDVLGRTSSDVARSSLDRGQRASPGPGLPHGTSPLGQRDHNAPSDEEVRAMSEMLPHGERAVLRAYLQQYGEPSFALTAYIEDEKNGTLMRA